jgi:hypothetical protein
MSDTSRLIRRPVFHEIVLYLHRLSRIPYDSPIRDSLCPVFLYCSFSLLSMAAYVLLYDRQVVDKIESRSPVSSRIPCRLAQNGLVSCEWYTDIETVMYNYLYPMFKVIFMQFLNHSEIYATTNAAHGDYNYAKFVVRKWKGIEYWHWRVR